MNPIVETLQRRIAGRSIDPEALPPEIVTELLEAARLTPSCYNKQPWRFLVLQSKEAREKGNKALSAGNQPWAGRAPLLIFAYARAEDDCQIPDGREYFQFDLGMAVMNLMLAATARGLVARPMAGFDPEAVKRTFGLEAADRVLAAIAVGRPSSDESHLPAHFVGLDKKPRERKPAEAIAKVL